MSIVVQGVTKLYGSQKALDNVSFEIKTGEIVGFLGPNGAGKSTMMKIITGFMPPSSGKVFVNGIDTAGGSLEIKKRIGYLPENNPLYPEMYVREYLQFAASLYKTDLPVREQIDNIIKITGLQPEQKKKIGSLSKGYRQRVGLAQALIHNPDVLILDEATTGLDPNQIVEIRNLIRDAGKEKTVMLSTHILPEVSMTCERVIIINRGRVVLSAELGDLTAHGTDQETLQLELVTNTDVAPALGKLAGVRRVEAMPVRDGHRRYRLGCARSAGLRPQLAAHVVQQGWGLVELRTEETSLEEIYLKVIAADGGVA
mgnify:CR=1 FL=1